MKKFKYHIALACLAVFNVSIIYGQFSYDGCGELSGSDFKGEYLYQNTNLDLREPVKMAFDMHSMDNIDIYFVERYGNLKIYKGSDGSVHTLGSIDGVTAGGSGNNDGLVGIVLDPDFKENGWIYLTYSRNNPSVFRLSRFKISNGDFDPESELPMLDIPSKRGYWHTGGDLAFDEYGDLWWAVGDNTSYVGPASTNNLIGKILRIHPIPVPDGEKPSMGVGSTYEIPEGNLFAEGEDSENKTRPEIYIMGTRNPYTIGLDPVRRWIAWGEVGPDFNLETEEHNLFTEPGNAGWPFFAGDNEPMEGKGSRYDATLSPKNPSAPQVDFQGNTGLSVLPPAIPATRAYQQSCAISGPIYRYDPALESDTKLPPHFDRSWFMSDCNGGGQFWAAKLDEEGKLASNISDLGRSLLGGFTFKRPLDFETGPDGALYLMFYNGNYGSGRDAGIYKISYQGSCKPGTDEFPAIEKVGCMDPNYSDFDSTATHPGECTGTSPGVIAAHFNRAAPWKFDKGFEIEILESGEFEFSLFDISGKLIHTQRGAGRQLIELKDLKRGALYLIQLKTSQGIYSQKLTGAMGL